MEEKILASLNEINRKFDEMKQENIKLREDLNEKYESLKEELNKKHESLKEELNEKHESLKEELDEKHESLKEELKKEILDYMFLFEENYGRKINIMYEELTAKMQKDRRNEEELLRLEKRVDKNSAFIFCHENRITALEKSKK